MKPPSKSLARMLIDKVQKSSPAGSFPALAGIRKVESRAYYGSGYEDVQHRKPSIKNAQRTLKWNPTIPLEQSVEETLDFFLKEAVGDLMTSQLYLSTGETVLPRFG
jgi:UDP-4-amino-4-deoxy-L-arabinose formyltransferase/UDP-glucuronic acid dehydrogenase (UDP-4-keto-hexauronic acid decarboxylating)